MRVLHLGRFYNDQFGGLERHVDQLLRGLKPYCEAHNLVANDTFISECLQLDAYTVYKARSMGKIAGTALCPTMPFWARSLHRCVPYDIVHLHFPDPMAHITSWFLPSRIKLVITWHSDIVRQRQLLRLYRPFLNQIIDRADAIIAPTPLHFSGSRQLAISRHKDRFHVVPFGLDFTVLDRAATGIADIERVRAGAPAHIIFAVGRHVYYKGYEYLIRAMVHIPNTVLWIGGSGPLTTTLKNLVDDLGLNPVVRFLGRIPDEVLPLYYHACDVFCMPSVEVAEAFGLVQLEAMACGKPVVCCELHNGVTFVNEHGHTGLVVPPRDPMALAGALNTLLADPGLRSRMGQNGFKRAHDTFSVSAMVAGTLEVYEQVLSSNGRNSKG